MDYVSTSALWLGEDDDKGTTTDDQIEIEIKKIRDKVSNGDDDDVSEANNGKQAYKFLKEIGNLIERREMILERRRILEVVAQHEELHPPHVLEDCPICLESYINLDAFSTYGKFTCCGKYVCMSCLQLNRIKEKCPLCRAAFSKTHEEEIMRTENLANKNDGWAMCTLADIYRTGDKNQDIDHYKAAQWTIRAAEDARATEAMYSLSKHYITGMHGVFERSFSKSFYWCKAAADKGNAMAQVTIGRSLYKGDIHCHHVVNSITEREVEAIKYTTLAISKDKQFKDPWTIVASFILGDMFRKGYGTLNKSSDRSIFYLSKAAKTQNEFTSVAQTILATCLLDRCKERYRGQVYVTGFSIIPQYLYWYRKSLDNDGSLSSMLDEFNIMKNEGLGVEQAINSRCNSCKKSSWKLSQRGVSLKCCVRCKAVWYCGKECQRKDWKEGHKVDCFYDKEQQ